MAELLTELGAEVDQLIHQHARHVCLSIFSFFYYISLVRD